MKKASLITLLLLIVLIFGFEQVLADGIFDRLVAKKWQGTGKLLGKSATYDMAWSKVLNDQYFTLKFQNMRVVEGKEVIFNAHAYYKIVNEKQVEGVWFDSRGIYFPLVGSYNEAELIIDWGSVKTEQGRTIYTLRDSKNIDVTDFVLKSGKYLQFGDASYK